MSFLRLEYIANVLIEFPITQKYSLKNKMLTSTYLSSPAAGKGT
jgi:hypothetical protein